MYRVQGNSSIQSKTGVKLSPLSTPFEQQVINTLHIYEHILLTNISSVDNVLLKNVHKYIFFAVYAAQEIVVIPEILIIENLASSYIAGVITEQFIQSVHPICHLPLFATGSAVSHYSDITWASLCLKSPTAALFVQPCIHQSKHQSSALLALC